MNWVNRVDQCFVLNSCQQPDAYNLGNYEILIGVGQKKSLTIDHENNFNRSNAAELLERKTWKFFTIAYDYKNVIYPELESNNEDCLHWPILTLVEPVSVITLTKDGWLSVEDDANEGEHEDQVRATVGNKR